MSSDDFIGISPNRMKHIVGVANRCYQLAKDMKLSEEECRVAFMCGYLHDVGYAFSTTPMEHPSVGFELIHSFMKYNPEVIAEHGDSDKHQNIFLRILNTADLTINSKGETVKAEERLQDIERRYNSRECTKSHLLAELLELID